MRVLIVDDDTELLNLVQKALERDEHEVSACASAEQALEAFRAINPEIALVDLGLPGMSGEDLISRLCEQEPRIAVLVLTAQSAVSSRVRCLDQGADDYLTKPFAVAELRARVRALSRRIAKDARPSVFTWGAIRLDFAARRAERDGRAAPITAREWAILESLASRPGEVVERREIIERVWHQAEDESSLASLEVLIGRIRRKLATDLIATVRGQGYRLEPGQDP